MKPTQTFKLSKTAKRMVALMKGASNTERNAWKKLFIEAQLARDFVPPQEKKNK